MVLKRAQFSACILLCLINARLLQQTGNRALQLTNSCVSSRPSTWASRPALIYKTSVEIVCTGRFITSCLRGYGVDSSTMGIGIYPLRESALERESFSGKTVLTTKLYPDASNKYFWNNNTCKFLILNTINNNNYIKKYFCLLIIYYYLVTNNNIN